MSYILKLHDIFSDGVGLWLVTSTKPEVRVLCLVAGSGKRLHQPLTQSHPQALSDSELLCNLSVIFPTMLSFHSRNK